MKYIKKYESKNIELKEFMYFLTEFIYQNTGLLVIKKVNFSHKFYTIIPTDKKNFNFKKKLFEINDIDYISGDNHRYFSFYLEKDLEKLPINFYEKDNLIKVINTTIFIHNIITNFITHSNMVKYEDIPKIIEKITKENLEIFINSKNYNL